MFTLLSIAVIVYIWTRPSAELGFFSKLTFSMLTFFTGCCVGTCAGTL